MRPEAAEDALWAGELCRGWGVPFFTDRADVPAMAAREKLSPEDAARRARYAFLRQAAADCGADRIALAHHAADQAETMLLHLLRGAGLAGLCGMRPLQGDLIRPLLETPSQAIEEYFRLHRLSCREDRTNLDCSNPRNALRHRVLPRLREIAPEAEAAFARAARILQEDEDFLSGQTDRLLRDAYAQDQGVTWTIPRPLPERALLTRCVRGLYRMAGERLDLDRESVLRVCERMEKGSGQASLPHGMTAWTYRGCLHLGVKAASQGEAPLADGTVFRGKRYRLHRLACAPQGYREGRPDRQFFRAENFPEDVTLRTRRPGDYLCPPGVEGKKLLSDFLTDRRVPPWKKDGLTLIASSSRVLWIPELMTADRAFLVQEPQEPVFLIQKEDGVNP